MLVGRNKPVSWRVTGILVATVLVTVVGILGAAGLATVGLSDWPPRPSSPFGVILGFVLAAFVAFEMLLLPRKWLRGWRLGSTRVWMWFHVWIGLAGLPVVLLHAGFGFGGPLPAVTLILFLGVTFSGIWGLILQQWLPTKILAEVPGETVASQIDFTGNYHAKEAERLVRVAEWDEDKNLFVAVVSTHRPGTLITALGEEDEDDVVVAGPPAKDLVGFIETSLVPYLTHGPRSRSPLRSRTEAERRFKRLRDALPFGTHVTIDRLEELSDLRRQWDGQSQLNFWLHSWLVVHLPLSVGMTVLMVVHAARALKYW